MDDIAKAIDDAAAGLGVLKEHLVDSLSAVCLLDVPPPDDADPADWKETVKLVAQLREKAHTLSPGRQYIVTLVCQAVLERNLSDVEKHLKAFSATYQPSYDAYGNRPVGNPFPSVYADLVHRLRSHLMDAGIEVPEDPGEAAILLQSIVAQVPASCIGCGKCCRAIHGGKALFVILKDGDDVPEHMIDRQHEKMLSGDGNQGHVLKMHENGDCQAFQVETKTCGIYERRPKSCRVYPQGCSQCRWVAQTNSKITWWRWEDLERLFWRTVHPLELRELVIYNNIIPPYVVNEEQTADLKAFLLATDLSAFHAAEDVFYAWDDLRRAKERASRIDAVKTNEPLLCKAIE